MENRKSKTKGQLYWMDEDMGRQEFDAYISERIWMLWWKEEKLITPVGALIAE